MTNVDQTGKPISALVLLSGGLDSRLAVRVLADQGIAVHGMTFESPFFDARRARQAADQLRIPLIVEDFTADLIAILNGPRHGFGAGMNPCID
jgi:tRNA-uridine 2-sulfurtransferase